MNVFHWVFVSANLINGGKSLEVVYAKEIDVVFTAGRSGGIVDGQFVWSDPPEKHDTVEELKLDIFEPRDGRIVLVKTKLGTRTTKQVTKIEEKWDK